MPIRFRPSRRREALPKPGRGRSVSFLGKSKYLPAASREKIMIDRRQILAAFAGVVVTPAFAQGPGVSRMTAYAFSFAGLNGGDIKLADYAGHPILVVNTASLCGYTPQYA